MKAISVVDAKYIDNYVLEVIFSDKKKQTIDFGTFLHTHSHPQFNKYKKEQNFKRFKMENGNIVWGKNWDMIFPVYNLYKGNISLT
jgi:hypothetical protein